MAELEFNIARLQQCLDVTVGTPSVGDVVQVTSTSPLTFDIAPGSGGTGVVETIVPEDPITVDATDPANPVVGVMNADGTVGQAGIVSDKDQAFNGIKTFLDVPRSPNAPLNGDELTNKAYVDTFAAGLQVKAAVRAATLVAGTLASSFENGDIIDGVTLATGDRILIKNQTNPIQNGIYTVNASGAPTRATDYNAAGEANAGTFTTVTEGGQNNTQWVQVNLGTPNPGTDALNFSRLNISAAVTSIQSPNTAHGTSGTLIGAVKLDSTDIYYNGTTGSSVKAEMVTVTTAGNASPQVISGAKMFTGAVDLQGGLAIATTQAIGTTSQQLATCAFVGTAVSNSITGAASTIRTANLTLNRALISNALGKVAVSPVTSAELLYLSGVTSAIQTQLNNKLNSTTAAATYAPIASPTFTGAPAAPTVTPSTDSTTKIATTAFVQSAIAATTGVSVHVTLTSAQILGAYVTPVTLIAAPALGSNQALQIISCAARYNFGTIAYTGGGTWGIYTTQVGSNFQTSGPASLILLASKYMSCGLTGQINNLYPEDALVFKNITGSFLSGDGTLDLYITYRVITL